MLVPFFPKAENLEQSQWRRPFAEAGLGNGRAMSSVMHEAPGSFSGCGSSSLCCSDVSWLLAQNQRNQSRDEGAVLQAMGRVGGVAFTMLQIIQYLVSPKSLFIRTKWGTVESFTTYVL